MGLFQKAPSTPEEYERSKPLAIAPDQVLEMEETEWYARVYRGDGVPQLTWRSVLMGSVLGFFLAFTNLYVGMKTGWAVGVAITACILSFAIWSAVLKAGLAKTQLTILENNCMQSTASSAGYSTGGTMVSAIAALLLLSVTPEKPGGEHIPLGVLILWTLFLASLGVFLAIPMKRNMINQERLKFPSGTAAAVTLQSLYSEGQEALIKARALFVSMAGCALIPLLIDLNARVQAVRDAAGEMVSQTRVPLLPAYSSLFDWLPGVKTEQHGDTRASDWTLVMDHNPVMIAAGALVGLRISAYMVLGHLLLAYVFGPVAVDAGWVNEAGETIYAAPSPGQAWRSIGIWIGAPILVSSGLLAFAFQWRTIVRAFTGFGSQAVTRGEDGEEVADPSVEAEVPGSWFLTGTVLSGAGVVWLANAYFEVPVVLGSLAVLMTFVLSLVACRATGESDITPVGAMGKIMQLTYGVLIPQNAVANLQTAGITAGAAGSSADLLNDLKSGYLLGANPRRQFVAQFLGIFSGTAATVIGFRMLVPDATVMTGTAEQAPEFPAPSAQAWKAVADVFVTGFQNMHPMWQDGIKFGLAAGAVMVILETLLPKERRWLPSATGIGLGFILPFQYPLSMLIGAIAATLLARNHPKTSERYTVAVASGIIAGTSIMGVIVAILNNTVFAD